MRNNCRRRFINKIYRNANKGIEGEVVATNSGQLLSCWFTLPGKKKQRLITALPKVLKIYLLFSGHAMETFAGFHP